MFPWVSFLLYILIMTYTPGPNNIMSMNNAKNVGFKKGLRFNFGQFTGTFLAMLLCMVFSAVLYNVVPAIQLPMKILGSAYMAYLIYRLFFPSKKEKENKSGVSFLFGIMIQFINPKVFIFGLTAMSSFVLPYFSKIPILVFISLLMSIIGFTSILCWALFGSLFSLLFEKHGKILNIVMAVLLLYCIVSLFI